MPMYAMVYALEYSLCRFWVGFREFSAVFILSLLYEVIHVYQLHMGSDLGNSMSDLV
jgi:hypothetical protein